jgi:hypothetical protein
MFSTVDSPSARLLRLTLVTADGEARVDVPAQLTQLAMEARTAPTSARLHGIATTLARGRWVPQELTTTVQRYMQLAQNGNAHQRPPDDSLRFLMIRLGLLRMLSDHERAPAPPVHILSARVELWREEFDAHTRTIVVRCIDTATASAPQWDERK